MDESATTKKTENPQTDSSCPWPISYMNKETYKKGDILFKKGDTADKMFYIKSGSIKLLEINKVIGERQVLGEMGIFSPFKERTASALCDEDVEAYTMGREEVIKFFGQDPALAISLMQISFRRFIENLKAETAARERIESELRIAQEIQASMLPRTFPPFPHRKDFDIFAIMDPAREVGGDLYDFFIIDEKKLGVSIGDVSGKGVPAALFMAITRILLKTAALSGLSAEGVVNEVNNILCPENNACMFVTVFFMILNTETGELECCNAGHNPPLLYNHQGGKVNFLEDKGGCVVGVMADASFHSSKILLKPQDMIFLYTDGVTEAMNEKRELFSEKRLKDFLTKCRVTDVTHLVNCVREDIYTFTQGAQQSDDITMLALRYNGKGV